MMTNLEPARVAEAVARMALQYAVITSVDRDDLADGGASIFADTIRLIRESVPSCRIEVLIPDFKANRASLEIVMREAGGNQSKAAQWLGMNRNTLRRKLTDHNL